MQLITNNNQVRVFYLIVLLYCLSPYACKSQEISWKLAKHWRLYDLRNQKAFSLTIDSLKQFQSIDLPDDTMHFFLDKIHIWAESKNAVWMGLYVVTCETPEGITRKIVISNYGGFLFDPLTRRYHEVAEEVRDLWYEWLIIKTRSLIAIAEH